MRTTVDIWTYRDGIVAPDVSPRNVVGYGVEATDGSIGKVDDATYDVGSSFIVVDTGPWIFGKKVMLPAGVIQRRRPRDEKIMVDRRRTRSRTRPSSTTRWSRTRATGPASAPTTTRRTDPTAAPPAGAAMPRGPRVSTVSLSW